METDRDYTKYFFRIFFNLLFIVTLIGCSEENITEPIVYSDGDVISATPLFTFSTSNIEQILTAAEIPDSFDIAYSVQAIRVVYQTSDANDESIRASGALMIPLQAADLPLFSMQHGTETKRDQVASVNPMNSVEGVSGLITASIGYVTCIPDYPGFGESTVIHPYIHAQSLSKAVIDFIRAGKSYCNSHGIDLNEQLFLSGYSEGGYVTLATQKELEEKYSSEFNITAVAPMAGPYDLKGMVDTILQQSTYNSPAYIAFFITAYDNIYGWKRLDDIFNTPYAGMMPSLFDGTKTYSEINGQLPDSVSLLIKQSFITNYLNGNEQEFQTALEENTLLNWTPTAPIRFYHGDADETVPYQNSVTTMNNLVANGATDISLVTIEGGNHATAGLPAVMGMIEWFNSYKNITIVATF